MSELAAVDRIPTRRVLLVDDQPLILAGLRLVLSHQIGVEVIGEAANGVEAIEAVRLLTPEVVLMDVRMPVMDGIAATAAIMRTRQPPVVLVLTTYDLDELVWQALLAGASGFLLKDAPQQVLVGAIHAAAAGVSTMSPSVIKRMASTLGSATARRNDAALQRLTERETEVLGEIATGRSNAEIALRLYLTENTVKTHVARILSKLGLHSRTQAVVLAYDAGIVRAG